MYIFLNNPGGGRMDGFIAGWLLAGMDEPTVFQWLDIDDEVAGLAGFEHHNWCEGNLNLLKIVDGNPAVFGFLVRH